MVLSGVVSGIVQELLCGEVLAARNDLDDCKITEDGRHGQQRGNQNTGQHIGYDDAQERIQLTRTQNLGRFDQLLHIDCAQIVADALIDKRKDDDTIHKRQHDDTVSKDRAATGVQCLLSPGNGGMLHLPV